MNILIACEESQVECKAFRERGHSKSNGRTMGVNQISFWGGII